MNTHPQLGTLIAGFGHRPLSSRVGGWLGGLGVLCFGVLAGMAGQRADFAGALAFAVLALLSVAALGVNLKYRPKPNTAAIALYAKGLELLNHPDPVALAWGMFTASGRIGPVTSNFSICTTDGRRFAYAFIQHHRALLTVVGVMNALHAMDAAAKADQHALLWTFKHRDPTKTITAYERGLHVGDFWLDYGTVTDITLLDDGRSVRLDRLGKPAVVLDAAVSDFIILQALLSREVIDLHLVQKAKQRMQMQELVFSHAVITPAGVRAPDNRFWSWPKLNEALIALNRATRQPTVAERDALAWFAQQVQAPDVLLFMGLVISYIGTDYAQDFNADTLLLRLRAATTP